MTTAEFRELFERCFATLFDGESEFDDALRYACFGGGKRVRPVGVWLGASAVNAAPPVDEVLSLACAIELIHSYSLVHDDLPAMDNDDYRRGRLTVHKKFGEAAGIPFSLFLTKRSDAGCAERQARVRTDTIGHGERCLTMPYFLKGVVL